MRIVQYKRILLILLLSALTGVTVFFGLLWWRHRQAEGEVIAVLRIPDRIARMNAEARLRETNRLESAQIAAELLDSSDSNIRSGAVRAIPMLQAQSDVADTLARQLRTSHDRDVRLGCAINLMSVETPSVRSAYVYALRDSSDKVVQIACMVVGRHGGQETKAALIPVLNHASWRVRLEACKAMIESKTADETTLAALEQLSRESESVTYDAEIDEFDRMEGASGTEGTLGRRWGKLATIVDQARRVAAGNK
jgi:HEAT repeat protein